MKVYGSYTMFFRARFTDQLQNQTFQMIFTSPSSAKGNLDAPPVQTGPQPHGKRKKAPPKRPPVAVQLKMDSQVTPQSIAYAAVQVCNVLCWISLTHALVKLHFALCDASHWVSHYNGFNYEEFYEFIIDFFEADQTPEGKAVARELCDWWNRCVRDSASTSLSPIPLQTSVSEVSCNTGGLVYLSTTVIARSSTRTMPSTLVPHARLVTIKVVIVVLYSSNIILYRAQTGGYPVLRMEGSQLPCLIT